MPQSLEPLSKMPAVSAESEQHIPSVGLSPNIGASNAPLEPSRQPISADDNSAAKMQDQSGQMQYQAGAQRKNSIHKSEAIRRGLSFGPLNKTPGRRNSATGILKAKSKSPSSRLSRIAMSASDEIAATTGEGRIKKDRYFKEGDCEGAGDSSDEEQQTWSSGDEASSSGRARGRRRDSHSSQKSETSLAAGSEEGQPAIMVTTPVTEGEKSTSKRFIVHPNTNYDQPASREVSPTSSEDEELDAIRRAQRLAINSSQPDVSVAHRIIQTLVRGDFAQMQQEAEDGTRRVRTYLVATDLSDEAAFALEWTIGTVMRDGDTLFAVYAVDEEVGTGKAGDSLPVGEGAKAMQETAAVMEKMTAATQKGSLMSLPSPLSKAALKSGSRKSSAATSTDSRALSMAQQERLHALQKLSETCIGFLRKTQLQVRVVIEVIHCKSPKYMLTEAVSLPSCPQRSFLVPKFTHTIADRWS